MPKEPLISVIVNVYDSVPNLKKCLDTLMLQLYKNIEIICIDNSLSGMVTGVLYSYKSKDDRFKIVHTYKSNSSTAWNEGLRQAQGEYIHFINSNCWTLLDLYKVFADSVQKSDFDIYMFNASLYSEKFIDVPFCDFFDDENIKSVSENNLYTYKDINHIITNNLRVFNKIYRKTFLEDNKISFYEQNNYSEYLFNIQTLVKSNTIYINPEVYVRSREQLITEGSGTEFVFDIFNIIIELERFLTSEDIFKYYAFDIFNFICNALNSYYNYCPQELQEQYFNQMQTGLLNRFNSMPPNAQEIFKNIEEANFMLTSTYEEYQSKKQS